MQYSRDQVDPHGSGLLQLPNEVLLLILEELDEELYSLALLSRRLHYLSLPIYFSYHGIPDPATLPSAELVLDGKRFDKLLSALQIAMFVTDIKRISCTFKKPDNTTLKHVRKVHRLLSTLSHVQEVNLDFGPVTHYWNQSTSGLDWTEWTKEVGGLLQAVVEKPCTLLTIHNGESISMLTGMSHREPPGPETTQSRSLSSPSSRSALKKPFQTLVGKPSSTHGCGPPTISPHSVSCAAIETLNIRSSMLLSRDFSEWTIGVINMSPIRSLSLETSWLSSPRTFLPRITIPTLTTLSIQCSVEFNDLLKFLSRHHLITELNINSTVYVVPDKTSSPIGRLRHRLRNPDPFPRIPKNDLNHLTTLSATPAYLVHFLAPAGSLPKLRFVTILLHLPCDQYNNSTNIDQTLAPVRHRIKETVLSLKLSAECEHIHWANLGLDDGTGNLAHLRHNITSLELNIPCSVLNFLSWTDRPAFLHFLVRFPRLRHLSFADWPYSSKETASFIRHIKQHYGWIETVGLHNETHSVSTWLEMKSRSRSRTPPIGDQGTCLAREGRMGRARGALFNTEPVVSIREV